MGGVRGREGSDGAAAKNEGEGRIQLELKRVPGQGGESWKELEGSDREWNWRGPGRRSDQGEELIRYRFAWCFLYKKLCCSAHLWFLEKYFETLQLFIWVAPAHQWWCEKNHKKYDYSMFHLQFTTFCCTITKPKNPHQPKKPTTIISFYSSTKLAHTVDFITATNSTLCFITINLSGLIITQRSSWNTEFMKEMYKNFTDTLSLFYNISCEAQY